MFERGYDMEMFGFRAKEFHRMGILWIVIIVILVLALLGFFGRGRVF